MHFFVRPSRKVALLPISTNSFKVSQRSIMNHVTRNIVQMATLLRRAKPGFASLQIAGISEVCIGPVIKNGHQC